MLQSVNKNKENHLPSTSSSPIEMQNDKPQTQKDTNKQERLFIRIPKHLLDEVNAGLNTPAVSHQKPVAESKTLREMCVKEEDDQLETLWAKSKKSRIAMLHKEFDYAKADSDIAIRRSMKYLNKLRTQLFEEEIELIQRLKKRHETRPSFVPKPIVPIVRIGGSKRTKQVNRLPRA